MYRNSFYALHIGFGLCVMLMFGTNLHGQDPIFSQYFTQKMYLNPAYTGADYGISMNLANRQQMLTSPSLPWSQFATTNLEVAIELPNNTNGSGIGAQFTNSVQGGGPIRYNRIGLSYAFHSWDCAASLSKLFGDGVFATGLQVSWNWASLTDDGLIFRSDLDPILGLNGSTPGGLGAIDPDYLNFTQDGYVDVAGGALFYWNPYPKNARRKQWIEIGGAFHHIPSRRGFFTFFPGPDSSQSRVGQNPTRLTLHATYHFGDPRGQHLSPMYRVMFRNASPQSPFSLPGQWDYGYWSHQIGVLGQTGSISEFVQSAYGGAWIAGRFLGFRANGSNDPTFRLRQSIYTMTLGGGFNLKFKKDNYGRLGLAYDFNIANSFNDLGGTIEAILTLNFGDIKGYKNNCTSCPAY